MTALSQPYAKFLGTWILQPHLSNYEQGDSPSAGTYQIMEVEGRIVFRIDWRDADDKEHQVEFNGIADGTRVPFAGGELADELAIVSVSPRELNTYAYWQGREIMVAQRQLDPSEQAMRVTQLVRFPNGSHVANTSVYIRAVNN